MNGYRLLQVAGAALAVVMMLLMMRGTYDQGQYLTWGVLLALGIAVFAGSRWMDEKSKR